MSLLLRLSTPLGGRERTTLQKHTELLGHSHTCPQIGWGNLPKMQSTDGAGPPHISRGGLASNVRRRRRRLCSVRPRLRADWPGIDLRVCSCSQPGLGRQRTTANCKAQFDSILEELCRVVGGEFEEVIQKIIQIKC